jgi:ketosteroid isomerase-like protein
MDQDTVFAIERDCMERWRKGDPMGWAENSAEEIIYIDPGLVKPVIGIEEYTKGLRQIEGKVHYEVSEFIDPKMVQAGDAIILTYNYRSLKEAGSPASDQVLWNTTEVYARKNGQWKIVHTHWSYINHRLPVSLEVPLPVELEKPVYTGVLRDVMAVETEAMQRWRKGDPWGFIDTFDPEVTYFNPTTPARITGREALKAEYARREGKIHYDVMEFIDPKVLVYGDLAVLVFRYFSTNLQPSGAIASRTPWFCTKIYRHNVSAWQLAHNHWSFIRGERALEAS